MAFIIWKVSGSFYIQQQHIEFSPPSGHTISTQPLEQVQINVPVGSINNGHFNQVLKQQCQGSVDDLMTPSNNLFCIPGLDRSMLFGLGVRGDDEDPPLHFATCPFKLVRSHRGVKIVFDQKCKSTGGAAGSSGGGCCCCYLLVLLLSKNLTPLRNALFEYLDIWEFGNLGIWNFKKCDEMWIQKSILIINHFGYHPCSSFLIISFSLHFSHSSFSWIFFSGTLEKYGLLHTWKYGLPIFPGPFLFLIKLIIDADCLSN